MDYCSECVFGRARFYSGRTLALGGGSNIDLEQFIFASHKLADIPYWSLPGLVGVRSPRGRAFSPTHSPADNPAPGQKCLGFGFRVSGFGFRVSGFGLWALDFGFRVSGFGLWASFSGFRNFGFRFHVSGFQCWVQYHILYAKARDKRSQGQGLGLGVWGRL